MDKYNELLSEENDPTLIFIRNLNLSPIDALSGIFALSLAILFQVIYNFKSIFLGSNSFSFQEPVVRPSNSRFFGIEGYAFQEHYLYIPFNHRSLRMHYVDEGLSHRGVVLCIHGVPLWSHSFRKIIPGLVSAGYRVLAPDMIGFGKSDKLTDFKEYNLELHLESLWALLESTTRPEDKVFILGHNWGSLLGAILTSQRPERISKLTILNTNNLPDGELDLRHRFHGNVPEFLRYLIVDSFFLLFRTYSLLFGTALPLHPLFFALNPKYSKADLKGFTAPFEEKNERSGIVSFPQLVPVAPSDRYSRLFNRVRKFFKYTWKKPTQVIFSEPSSLPILQSGDFIVGNRRDFFAQLIPHAQISSPPLKGGHVIMYDNPRGVLAHLLPFLNGTY